MVEEPSAGGEEPVQVLGVLQVLLGADVFGHADGGDRVVGPVADVAVVLDADLDAVGQARVGHALTGIRRLFLREGDADDVHAVLAGRVQGHGAPAAADVEEALPGARAILRQTRSSLSCWAASRVVVSSGAAQ